MIYDGIVSFERSEIDGSPRCPGGSVVQRVFDHQGGRRILHAHVQVVVFKKVVLRLGTSAS